MTQQTTAQQKVVRFSDNTSETWALDELANYIDMAESDVKPLKAAVVGQMVQMKRDVEKANEKAQKAEQKAAQNKSQRKPKQSALEKFRGRAQGNMADGVLLMLKEYSQGIAFDKSGMSTTHRYMARNYGPPVLAVLYECDMLSDSAKAMIESYYKRQDS